MIAEHLLTDTVNVDKVEAIQNMTTGNLSEQKTPVLVGAKARVSETSTQQTLAFQAKQGELLRIHLNDATEIETGWQVSVNGKAYQVLTAERKQTDSFHHQVLTVRKI